MKANKAKNCCKNAFEWLEGCWKLLKTNLKLSPRIWIWSLSPDSLLIFY